jgi:hypothetical protein
VKSTVLWGVTLRSLVEVSRRFGEKYCLHLQGRRVGRTREEDTLQDNAVVTLCHMYHVKRFRFLKVCLLVFACPIYPQKWLCLFTNRLLLGQMNTIENPILFSVFVRG